MTINVELATKIGLKQSLLYDFLLAKQKEQNIFFEELHWAEVSLITLCKQFPFFNESEIRRLLDKMEKEDGLIKSFRANTIRQAKRYHIKEI